MRKPLLTAFVLAGLCGRADAAGPASANIPAPPAPARLIELKEAPEGFIDDAFTLSDDGAQLAYVTTDGATIAALHFVTVAGGAPVQVPGLAPFTTAVYWLGDAHVLVTSHDPKAKPGAAAMQAQAYDMKGKREKLPVADDFALGSFAGKPAVLSMTRKVGKKGADVTVTAFARDTLKQVGTHTLHEDAEGHLALPGGAAKPLWWKASFAQLAVLRAGEFDKARDMRRPDRFAWIDAFTGKVATEREISDVLGFAQLASDLNAAPDTPLFGSDRGTTREDLRVRVSDDRKEVRIVTSDGETKMAVPRPLYFYDPATLAFEEHGDGHLLVSLTVDPVNPVALGRKETDPDDIDFYDVDRKSGAAKLVMRLPGLSRPSGWRHTGGRIALLRKSKGFERGGVALEVYPLR